MAPPGPWVAYSKLGVSSLYPIGPFISTWVQYQLFFKDDLNLKTGFRRAAAVAQSEGDQVAAPPSRVRPSSITS